MHFQGSTINKKIKSLKYATPTILLPHLLSSNLFGIAWIGVPVEIGSRHLKIAMSLSFRLLPSKMMLQRVSLKQTRLLTTAVPGPSSQTSGAGIGNVESQLLPGTNNAELFKHCKYPRTASLIG